MDLKRTMTFSTMRIVLCNSILGRFSVVGFFCVYRFPIHLFLFVRRCLGLASSLFCKIGWNAVPHIVEYSWCEQRLLHLVRLQMRLPMHCVDNTNGVHWTELIAVWIVMSAEIIIISAISRRRHTALAINAPTYENGAHNGRFFQRKYLANVFWTRCKSLRKGMKYENSLFKYQFIAMLTVGHLKLHVC